MNSTISRELLEENLSCTGCSFRWSYPVIKYDRAQVRTCCSTGTNETFTKEQLAEESCERLFSNSDYILERRIEMLKGIKHSDCASCWELEASNIKSQRMQAAPLNLYLKKNLNFLTKSDFTSTDLHYLASLSSAHTLEIQLDNICDLACIYCNSNYSSTWEMKTTKTAVSIEKAHLQKFQEEFWKWFERRSDGIVDICIVGGEPLTSPNFYNVLDNLLLVQNKCIKRKKPMNLIITSNFNTRYENFSKFLSKLELLSSCFNIKVNASTEATGRMAEFIRDGLKWEVFDQNIHRFLNFQKKMQTCGNVNPIHFSVLASQNVFSLFCLPDFLQWVISLEETFKTPIKIQQNMVSFPAHFSITKVLSAKHSHFCYDGIEIIKQYKIKHADQSELRRWIVYEEFLRSLACKLEKSVPSENAQLQLKNWIQALSPIKRKVLLENFTSFSL